jgi:hypothetical protein
MPETPPTFDLSAVKRAVEDLPREDRARLRPWILAAFDVRSYPITGYVAPRTPVEKR